jgi:uncharacterized OB-fold protein
MPTRAVKLPEDEEGAVLLKTDPIVLKWHYEVDYLHSYAQDSPFFTGLTKGKLMGSKCVRCGHVYATPRAHCMEDGAETEWHELPLEGRVHSFTTCYYAGQAFLKETPYTLILVEFDGADTLFLSRIIGAEPSQVRIGMPVRAQFRRNCKFNPTDVYFVSAEESA